MENTTFTVRNRLLFVNFSHSVIASLFLLLLTACGGGGSGSNNNELVVSNLSPADNDTNVALDAAISATFNRDMFATTLTDSSFTLKTSAGDSVPASVTYDVAAKSVSLNSNTDLELLSQYTANLKPDITDLDGKAIADTLWQFTTRDGIWQSVSSIGANFRGDAFDPAIAVDSSGNALAVWRGTDNQILSQPYTPSNGWGTGQLIDIDTANSRNPQIAMDIDGNAIAVWSNNDGVRSSIWTNRYTPENGWGTAQLLETDNVSSASKPQITFDNKGNALAVWMHGGKLMFNRYLANNPLIAWGLAKIIPTPIVGNSNAPQITIDNTGNALLVWRQFDGIRSHIWSNRYVPDIGWDNTAQSIESNTGSAFAPQIAFDNNGTALVVWQQLDSSGAHTDIWSNRYTPENGWGTALLVETNDAGSANRAQIAFDNNGHALVVWEQADKLEGEDNIRSDIWSNRFTDNAWGTAELIEMDDSDDASSPQIAIDKNGNALAVWQQSDEIRTNIWSNRYVFNSGWGMAQLIESDNSGNAIDPKIEIDGSGRAIAVWQQTDESNFNLTKIKSNGFR